MKNTNVETMTWSCHVPSSLSYIDYTCKDNSTILLEKKNLFIVVLVLFTIKYLKKIQI